MQKEPEWQFPSREVELVRNGGRQHQVPHLRMMESVARSTRFFFDPPKTRAQCPCRALSPVQLLAHPYRPPVKILPFYVDWEREIGQSVGDIAHADSAPL